jgi:hypothetical protein
MNRWPLPNSVLVVDNASIHKVAGIREAVEEHGARLLFLPARAVYRTVLRVRPYVLRAWTGLPSPDPYRISANSELKRYGTGD